MSSTVQELLPHLEQISFCAGMAVAWIVFPLYHIVLDGRD